MTKQITNNNNQTSKRLKMFEKLELEYCKAELGALRLDTWNLVIGAYLEIK